MEVYSHIYGASAGKGAGVLSESRGLERLGLTVSLRDLSVQHALSATGQESDMISYLLSDGEYSILGTSYVEGPKSSGYDREAPCGVQYVAKTSDIPAEKLGKIVNFVEFKKTPAPAYLHDFPLADSGYTYHHSPAVLAALTDGLLRAAFSEQDALLVSLPRGKSNGHAAARYALAEAVQCLPGQLRKKIRFFTSLPADENDTDPVVCFDKAVSRFGANVVFCQQEHYQQILAQRSCIGLDMDRPDGTDVPGRGRDKIGAFAQYIARAEDKPLALAAVTERPLDGFDYLGLNQAAGRLGNRAETIGSLQARLEEKDRELRTEHRMLMEAQRQLDQNARELASLRQSLGQRDGRLRELSRIAEEAEFSRGRNSGPGLLRILTYVIPVLCVLAVAATFYYTDPFGWFGREPEEIIVAGSQPAPVWTQPPAPEETLPEGDDAPEGVALPGEDGPEGAAVQAAGGASEAPEESAGPAFRPGKVKGDGVNMRARPGRGSGSIAILPNGTQLSVGVEVESDDRDGTTWYQVTCGSFHGYIRSDYVSVE